MPDGKELKFHAPAPCAFPVHQLTVRLSFHFFCLAITSRVSNKSASREVRAALASPQQIKSLSGLKKSCRNARRLNFLCHQLATRNGTQEIFGSLYLLVKFIVDKFGFPTSNQHLTFLPCSDMSEQTWGEWFAGIWNTIYGWFSDSTQSSGQQADSQPSPPVIMKSSSDPGQSQKSYICCSPSCTCCSQD